MKDRDLVISLKTIFITILAFFLLWLFWLIKDVLMYLFIAMILALALEPFVDALVRKKIPKGVAVVLVALAFIVVIGGLGSVALTPFIQQSRVLMSNFPSYVQRLSEIPGVGDYFNKLNESLLNQISATGENVISVTIGAFSGVLSAVVVLVFTIYILLDFNNIRLMFVNLFPKDRRSEVQQVVNKIEFKLGGWLRGQVVLMLIIGIASYIGLIILGVDYALALAVTAGLLEIVPIIGPIISAIPAIIVGFVISPAVGVGVLILYILIQQLENNLIVPKVMQKAVGYNPLITIIALMVGSQLLGIIGAILAIPFLIIFTEVAKYILEFEV